MAAAGRGQRRRSPLRRGSFAASLLPFQDPRLDHRRHQHGASRIGALHPDRGQGSNRTGSSVAARTPESDASRNFHLTLNFLVAESAFLPRWLSVTLAVYEPSASLVPAGMLTVLPGRILTAATVRFFVPRAPLTLTVPVTGSSVLPVFLTGMHGGALGRLDVAGGDAVLRRRGQDPDRADEPVAEHDALAGGARRSAGRRPRSRRRGTRRRAPRSSVAVTCCSAPGRERERRLADADAGERRAPVRGDLAGRRLHPRARRRR